MHTAINRDMIRPTIDIGGVGLGELEGLGVGVGLGVGFGVGVGPAIYTYTTPFKLIIFQIVK